MAVEGRERRSLELVATRKGCYVQRLATRTAHDHGPGVLSSEASQDPHHISAVRYTSQARVPDAFYVKTTCLVAAAIH
jgi:hypothetical protein